MSIEVIKECNALAMANEITFPEVVGRFMAEGIERYRVDFVLGKNIYYWSDGRNYIEDQLHKTEGIGPEIDKQKVHDAVRQIQRGEIGYKNFVRLITEAGCSHYDAYLTGRRVIYSGRNGDAHTELFPDAK